MKLSLFLINDICDQCENVSVGVCCCVIFLTCNNSYISPVISRRRLSVFRQSMHASVCDHKLEICVHDILQTACENFAKFTTQVQLQTRLN